MTGPGFLGLSQYPKVRHHHRRHRCGRWWLAFLVIVIVLVWLVADRDDIGAFVSSAVEAVLSAWQR